MRRGKLPDLPGGPLFGVWASGRLGSSIINSTLDYRKNNLKL